MSCDGMPSLGSFLNILSKIHMLVWWFGKSIPLLLSWLFRTLISALTTYPIGEGGMDGDGFLANYPQQEYPAFPLLSTPCQRIFQLRLSIIDECH